MSEGGLRRAVAEIRFGEDRAGLTKVGGRSIHQYWSLLSPHFRDVLLAPQRRSDDGGVAWNWREAADRKPPTASELASVRKRLERANESFAENPVSPLMSEGRSGTSSQALIDQVASKVKAMADSLAAKSDAALADFVCRTESGVMVHSWGVVSPAQVIYPDSLETGISGVVVVGGKPAAEHEVVIENAQGLSVARMQSDEAGEFHFSKLAPGRYRVRVVSGRAKFQAKGTMVSVERGAVTRVELRSISDATDPNESAADETAMNETSPGSSVTRPAQNSGGRKWVGKTLGALLVLLLLGGGGVWAWRTWSTSEETAKNVSTHRSSMAPEAFSAGENKAETATHSNRPTSDEAGLGASVDGVGILAHRPALRSNNARSGIVATRPKGAGRSSSTIGSKIEVLSGVAAGPNSGEASVAGVTEQPVGSGSSGQESSLDSASPAPVLGASEIASNLRRKRSGLIVASSLTDDPLTKSRGAQTGEAEVISSDGANLLTGDNSSFGPIRLPGAKKPAARQAQAIVSTGEAPASGEQKMDEITTSGHVPEAEPSGEVAANSPVGGLPPDKAPTSKVIAVNKGLLGEKPQNSNERAMSDAGSGVAGQNMPKPDSTKSVRAKRTSSDGAKASTRAGSAVAGEAEGPTPEQNDAAPLPAVSEKDQASGSAAAAAGESRDVPIASGSIGVDETSATVSGDRGPSAAQEKTKTATARSSIVQRQSGSTKNTTTTKIGSQRDAAAGDSSPDDSRSDSSAEHLQAGDVGTVFQFGNKMLTVAIQMAGTETRMARDTIIPTLPVLVGEDDAFEAAREKFVLAQKALVPETFKHPLIQRGFIFELPKEPSDGVFHWKESPRTDGTKRTTKKNQAELSWYGETFPIGSTSTLVSDDGLEVVRLSVGEKGNLSLKVAEGVRCSLWLSVSAAKADEPVPASGGRPSRFGWLINRVAFSTPSQPAKLAPDDHDLSITIPLALSKNIRIEAAVTDRNTGWALVTKIQIQPVP